MKSALLALSLLIAAGAAVWAQRERPNDYAPYEVRSLFPHENAPAQFTQVDPREIQTLADQGWELVSVMPYVYRNEERGNSSLNPRPMVTQTYPAYFFKRAKRTVLRPVPY